MTHTNRFAVAGWMAAILLFCLPSWGADQTIDGTQEEARKQLREEARREAEHLVAAERVNEFVAAAKQTSDSLAILKGETTDFSALSKNLLQNEDGKRIAIDDVSFLVFLRVTDDPPPSADDVEAKKKAVDAIVANVQATTQPSVSAVAFVPPPSMTEEISEDKDWAVKGRATIESAEAAIRASIASHKDADVSKAITLQQRVDAYNLARVQSLAKSRASGEEDKRPESEQSVRDAAQIAELQRGKAEAERIIQRQQIVIDQEKLQADAEMRFAQEKNDRQIADLNKQLADSEAHRAVVNAQADATREKGAADAEKIRLQQKCNDPAVKKLLEPFASVGLWQPGDRPGSPWMHDRGPMSLKLIKAIGALQKSEKGLLILYQIGNATNVSWTHSQNPDTERPKWGYPNNAHNLSQSDWAEVQKAQDLLNELGETMVEQKMLSP